MGKKGVLKKAKKLELKGTQENKINFDVIPALEEILHDVYAICRPKPIDYFNRKDLVRIFNVIAREIYGNSDDIPVVEEFGSFLMDIFSAKSDLDVSVNFGNKEGDFPQEKKIQSLRKFAKKLYALRRKGHVSSLQPILTAKVPILKIVDRGTGIECDISIENRDGILKSQIVRMICSIDERFQMLCFLVKVWAKAHGINSSKDRTLNSLSIISLVAFHLQMGEFFPDSNGLLDLMTFVKTRDPPILPPFSALFKDGIDPAPVGKILNNFLDFGKMNKESLGELFVTLLVKLASVETLWPKGLCASIYDGSWIYRTWESTSRKKLDSKFGCISVEDFTDRSLNVARAVGKKQVGKIYKIIHLSIYYISAFMDGQIQGTKLRELLFGRECMPSLEDKSIVDGTVVADFSLDPTMTKKMRRTGGLGETERSVNCNTIQTKIVHWKGPPTKGWDATLVEGSGGKHVSIHLDPIHPKAVQSMVVWGGKPVEGWGEHVSIHLDQIQPKGVQSTVVWGGAPVEGWGEKHVSIQPKGVQSMVVWGGTPVEGWGEKHVSTQPKGVQSTVVWGGTPIEGWGEKHVSIHLDQIKPKVMHSKVVWGGTPVEGWGGRDVSIQLDQSHEEGMLQSAVGGGRIQQASHSDPIQTKEAQSLDGWRQWGGGSVSNVSAKHLSVLDQKPIGIRKSSQRSHRPNKRRGPHFRGCGNW